MFSFAKILGAVLPSPVIPFNDGHILYDDIVRRYDVRSQYIAAGRFAERFFNRKTAVKEHIVVQVTAAIIIHAMDAALPTAITMPPAAIIAKAFPSTGAPGTAAWWMRG